MLALPKISKVLTYVQITVLKALVLVLYHWCFYQRIDIGMNGSFSESIAIDIGDIFTSTVYKYC